MTRFHASRFGWIALFAIGAALSLTEVGVAQQGIPSTAKGLNGVNGDDPMTAVIVHFLKNKEAGQKILAEADKLTQGKDQPFNVNATWMLSRIGHGLEDTKISEKFYRIHIKQAIALESGEKLARAFSGLIQLLYENKKFDAAEKVCREFLELDGGETVESRKPIVLRQMILIMARQGQFDRANDLLDRMIRANPKNWLNLELKGRLLREAGKLEESAKTYEDVVKQVTEDDRLNQDQKDLFIGDVRYALSGVYVEMKQIDKAAAHLKALLKKEPDNSTYNNDLGYIWADNDMNLVESERLIRKALEDERKVAMKADSGFDPDEFKPNPAYLDSLGWVLFKRKKYEEAKEFLVQAVAQEGGRHLEIYDHLADVYVKLGEKDKALEAWKKGLETATDSRRDKERKKIVEKKMAEIE